MIGAGKTKSSEVRYVEEIERGPRELGFNHRVAELSVRDWDVTDPEARRTAAEEQLGEGAHDDEWYSQHAMWFINSKDNSAVLIVFRPKVEQPTHG